MVLPHGGSDPGASGNQIIEKDLNLKISQYMLNRFKDLGVPVFLTRDSDEDISNTDRVSRMKKPFGDVSNAVVVSNHINAGGGEGAEVIYPLRSTPELAKSILNELGNAGQIKRKYYQRSLPDNPSKDYYYIMRDTNKLQTLIVEYGFLDNINDANKLKANWQKYAESVVKAITNYMGYLYNSSGSDFIIHTVKKGESLYSIARDYGTTVSDIKRQNNLTSDLLSVGQQLIIGGSGSSIPETPSKGNIAHTVKKGESLYSIANQYGVTVTDIKRLNNLTSDNLSIGQVLQISGTVPEPVPEPSGNITHTVKSGESLYSIAKKYGTNVDDIKRLNNLTNNNLSIGQVLQISGTVPEPVPEPSGNITHTVKSGESLYSIARQYATTVANIKRLNNLTSDNLSIGQTLKINGEVSMVSSSKIHEVLRGETLWSIANQYNMLVEEIKRLNNLTNNVLSIGQKLIVSA